MVIEHTFGDDQWETFLDYCIKKWPDWILMLGRSNLMRVTMGRFIIAPDKNTIKKMSAMSPPNIFRAAQSYIIMNNSCTTVHHVIEAGKLYTMNGHVYDVELRKGKLYVGGAYVRCFRESMRVYPNRYFSVLQFNAPPEPTGEYVPWDPAIKRNAVLRKSNEEYGTKTRPIFDPETESIFID